MSAGGTLAIIPVRSLTTGKLRLASAVDPATRSELTRRMLAIGIRACRSSGAVDQVLVISPDQEALSFALTIDPDLVAVRQSDLTPGLVPALDQARSLASAGGYSSIMILFADLPLLTGDDVAGLLAVNGQVVVAPDQAGSGTNALVVRQGLVDLSGFQFRFGTASFPRHVLEAKRLGIMAGSFSTAGLGFDLDTPHDLGELISFDPAGVSANLRTGS